MLVRAVIAGKTYWLDGTRQGDTTLDSLPSPPNYYWVLPLSAKGSELEKVSPAPFLEPQFESVVKLDARGGLDVPAPAHAEHIFRGDAGVGMHVSAVVRGAGGRRARLAGVLAGQDRLD
ncbi:MAG: hypothetical protein WDN45_16455 [Caulobacteraceae bacterium]